MSIDESLWEIFTKTGNPDIYILHKNIREGERKRHAGHNCHRVSHKTVGIR